MLKWNLLLSEQRRKERHAPKGENTGTRGNRTEAERDFDRILFASPTRRLADKTQVFPLDPSDSIRTRLTHSHEVSNLARSIGMSLAFNYAEDVFGASHEELMVKRKIPAMLAAIGLAHDLGNPPFGHQGEVAVKGWFEKQSKSGVVHDDFRNFDGNPHTFRLLTRLQILNDDFGLNLTVGTLAAVVKYPSLHGSKINGGYKKFGVFESEREIIEEVWDETGLVEGMRHPLTHIVEACDDIAYAVVDAEDTVKKGFASFYDLMDHLGSDDDEIVKEVVSKSLKKNQEYKREKLSSSELNEISMQMFRVFAIYHLIDSVTESYVSHDRRIMNCEIEPDFQLIKNSKGAVLCQLLKGFDIRHGFQNREVLELELRGQNYIHSTMDMLWYAICEGEESFSRYGRAMISENYRRVHERSKMDAAYKDCQLLCDSVSGMTDSYLINIHDQLRPLYNGIP